MNKIYTPNNILFRIVSSTALAQYKMDQAFDFNELIHNKEFSFSQESRETLLLNYELWFRFICRLERILIRNESAQEKLGVLASHTEVFAYDIINEIDEIIQTHHEIFTPRTKFAVEKAFRVFIEFFLKAIRESSTQSMYVAFPSIVASISNCLHNLLFILHEIESLKKNDGNYFLSYTNKGALICGNTGVCPLNLRAKVYQEMYGASEFTIKNYSDRDVDQKCIDQLINQGFIITSIVECHNRVAV